jgi:hypothetical protein
MSASICLIVQLGFVHEHFDGALTIRRQGRSWAWREISLPQKQSQVVPSKEINRHLDAISKGRSHKPAATHPWRGGARRHESPLRGSGLRPTPSTTPHDGAKATPPANQVEQTEVRAM